MTTFFTVDFFNNTINGSVANFKKASLGCGEAYDELVRLMNTHPTFTLNKIAPKKRLNRSKRTFEGLTLDFINDYIKTDANSDALMREFVEVKKVAKEEGIKEYPFVKKWFLNKVDNNESTPFDMDKAKERIAAYYYKMAELASQKNVSDEAEIDAINSTNTEINKAA